MMPMNMPQLTRAAEQLIAPQLAQTHAMQGVVTAPDFLSALKLCDFLQRERARFKTKKTHHKNRNKISFLSVLKAP